MTVIIYIKRKINVVLIDLVMVHFLDLSNQSRNGEKIVYMY